MKRYLKKIYLNQPQKVIIFIVFLLLIVFCILPLVVNQNSILGIIPFFDKYGNIVTWCTTILIAILPALLKFLLSKFSRNSLAKNSSSHDDNVSPSDPHNTNFVGIIAPKDLEQLLSVEKLLTEKSVHIGNQKYILTNDTITWLQKQSHSEITAFEFFQQQDLLYKRDFSGFINAVERVFTTNSSQEIVLTGRSGCGKSLFISMFKLCYQDTYDIFLFNRPYAVESNVFNFIEDTAKRADAQKKTLLILDQFEGALTNSELSSTKLIDKLRKTEKKNIVLIYVIREDKIAGIFSTRNDIAIPVYSLALQKNDIEQLKLKCCNYLRLGNEELEQALKTHRGYSGEATQVIIPLLESVLNGNIPLVAFELVCSIMENGSLTSPDNKQWFSATELSNNPEKIMYYYFDEWVNQFSDQKSGLAILYYLSDYFAHSVEDIQNISFCKSIVKKHMTKFGFINVFEGASPLYEFAHDYLADVARHYCRDYKSFSETIAENIDFYSDETTVPTATIRARAKKRVDNYCSKVNRNLVNTCLYILLIGSGIACVHHALPLFMSPNAWKVLSLTAILINCLLSTLYIYSFCVDFLIIYGRLAILPLSAYGAISIILAIAVPSLWAISLSIESFVLAGTIFFTCRKEIQKKAVRSFYKTAGMITAFSLITVFLGLVYLFFFSGFHVQVAEGFLCISIENFSSLFRGLLEVSYYGLYFAVIISSVFNHCLTSYFFERIGLANRFIDKTNS